MTSLVRMQRAGPLTTIQDAGRFGFLADGVSASGPMDRPAFLRATLRAGAAAETALEFTMAGLDLEVVSGTVQIGWDGGHFSARINDHVQTWPGNGLLEPGDILRITPGAHGNYGYLAFGGALDVNPVLHSLATSTRARIGGLSGRALRAGDVLSIEGEGTGPQAPSPAPVSDGPIRFIWGLHAELFPADVRQKFVTAPFRVTPVMDRMGIRLDDRERVFEGASILSLVSDPIVPGDIQILGDGTPIVLMRDHQPTGGYPRIGTVISADIGRLAQIRPGGDVEFAPVTVEHAQRMLRSQT